MDEQLQQSSSTKKIIAIVILYTVGIGAWAWFLGSRGSDASYAPQTQADPFAVTDPLFEEDTTVPDTAVELEAKPVLSPSAPAYTLTNSEIGVSLNYSTIFQYGIEESAKATMIQIATYNLNTYFDSPAFPGIKLEIVSEKLLDGETLTEHAAAASGEFGESISFQKATLDGRDSLKRLFQENDMVTLSLFTAIDDTVYLVSFYSNLSDYTKHKDTLDEMIASMKFGI